MFLQLQHSSLYAAFDVYPSAKGAATHIYHNAETLFETMKGGWLSVLGSPKFSTYEREGNVEITRFSEEIPNFLHRTEAYQTSLFELLLTQKKMKLAHFRDIWGGLPILSYQKKHQPDMRSIFEVNGLPSIELPYRYPRLSPSTLNKIKQLEQYCMANASFLLTPSEVIKEYLIQQEIPPSKIKVITNGADTPRTFERPPEAPEKYVIYFGALQPWQGMDTLLKALKYLQDFSDLKLVICASTKAKYTKFYRRWIEKWQLTEKVIWLYQLPKKELYSWIRFAQFSIAPLKQCTRNLVQGCCPLKILESMAIGTPVVASDLPAIREIMPSENIGKFFRADRPADLARSMRILLEYTDYTENLGKEAQKHVYQSFTWLQKREELKNFYKDILAFPPKKV